MNRKMLFGMVAGGALVATAVLGAFTYRAVSAQATTPTPNAPATTNGAGLPGPGRGMRGDGYSEQDVATALGVSLETYQAAEKTATDEALKQAVADGLITQAQADQLAQDQANGRPYGRLPFLNGSSIDYDALLAKALNITTDQLKAAYQKAFEANVNAAVQNGTLTQQRADAAIGGYVLSNSSKFQSAMKSAYTAAVNQAVSDGLITQAQADALLANSSNLFFGGMGGFGGPGGRGGHGGPGGPGGPGDWGAGAPANQANPGSTTPSTPTTVPSSNSNGA